MFAQKLLIYCSHWTRARSNTRRLVQMKKETSPHQRHRDKKTNVVGNASPQCPLERAPWSILTHWCCDKRFSTNRSSFNDKNYISTHHNDHESAAIYPANCGLSFSLLLCTASCSQIFGKLKGKLCWPSMISHDPSCSHDCPNNSSTELVSLSGLSTAKYYAALASQRSRAHFLRWNCYETSLNAW